MFSFNTRQAYFPKYQTVSVTFAKTSKLSPFVLFTGYHKLTGISLQLLAENHKQAPNNRALAEDSHTHGPFHFTEAKSSLS